MSPPAEIDRIFEAQRRRRSGRGPSSAAERIEAIRRLERAVLDARDEIRQALWDDLRKPPQEVDLGEIYTIVSEARHARRRLRRWMRPKRVRTPLALLGTRSRIVYEPKGVVLIVSPWNFPFNLTFGPLISALAAGNSVVLKPSEMTPSASACMSRIVSRLFAEDQVAVIEGDALTSEALLRKPFDHIFFTGSPAVGRLVMRAAAEHLTPVTLELGGKSPVIVERSADLEKAARRIAWGKFVNSGQICIAPDYVLVDEAVHDDFIAALRRAIASVPQDEKTLIINDRHASRLNRLIDGALKDGAELVTGGTFEGRRAPATVVTRVPLDSAAMNEEIFGPLLPVVPYRTLDEAIGIIAARPRPLVLYIFSRDRKAVSQVLARTTAGGTVINHTLIHFYQLNLPYGGAGQSGMGRGHGFFGFEAFSNVRGVLGQVSPVSVIEHLVPPYNRIKDRVIHWLIRYL
ncbi:MAG TPA: aldehyde dehydrogenase family protein [Thermoanaerobaculia bacterium]|nr:aldehyde dehydrogenase family protein [Thermoanaerobaculia bacterium]